MEDHERSRKVMNEHLVSWSEEMSSEQFELVSAPVPVPDPFLFLFGLLT